MYMQADLTYRQTHLSQSQQTVTYMCVCILEDTVMIPRWLYMLTKHLLIVLLSSNLNMFGTGAIHTTAHMLTHSHCTVEYSQPSYSSCLLLLLLLFITGIYSIQCVLVHVLFYLISNGIHVLQLVNVALLCIGMIKFLLSAAAISVSHVRTKLEHNGLTYDGREWSVKP